MAYAEKTSVSVERTRAEIGSLLERKGVTRKMFGDFDGAAQVIFELGAWRVKLLLLIIKAKFEAVESGIVSMEEEFLPYMMTGDGRTIAECVIPQMDGNSLPPLLPWMDK